MSLDCLGAVSVGAPAQQGDPGPLASFLEAGAEAALASPIDSSQGPLAAVESSDYAYAAARASTIISPSSPVSKIALDAATKVRAAAAMNLPAALADQRLQAARQQLADAQKKAADAPKSAEAKAAAQAWSEVVAQLGGDQKKYRGGDGGGSFFDANIAGPVKVWHAAVAAAVSAIGVAAWRIFR